MSAPPRTAGVLSAQGAVCFVLDVENQLVKGRSSMPSLMRFQYAIGSELRFLSHLDLLRTLSELCAELTFLWI